MFRPVRRSEHLCQGFTLLELMVVLIILGAMGSGILLSMDFVGQGRRLLLEGERIQQLLGLMQEEAMLRGRSQALDGGEEGYRVLEWSGDDWSPRTRRPFASHPLDAGLELQWLESLSTEDPDQPESIFRSDGDYSPFRLQLLGENSAPLNIVGDGWTPPRLTTPGEG